MLNVIILNVIMLNVILLNVILLNVIILNVIMLNVTVPCTINLKCFYFYSRMPPTLPQRTTKFWNYLWEEE
jgi:hypothetical protein